VIDLHLHTTTSDGRHTPAELVSLCATAGLRVIAVTDHDTTAAVAEVRSLAEERGMEAVPGIEVTAVEAGRDVHVLGYFCQPDRGGFAVFLSAQREARIARALAIGQRLSDLDVPIALDALVSGARAQPNRSVGRPQIARAMVAAGHARDVADAFDRWLGSDGPAFVPRVGPSPEAVIAVIHRAGGLASLAHPGRTRIDHRIEALRDAGLDALEVYHRDHDVSLVERYRRLASDLALLATGGSDFHGEPRPALGIVALPEGDWKRLVAARSRHA
jgi:predicted metal-dependent phosphoesterase TrpH